jgi:hypothetical protein
LKCTQKNTKLLRKLLQRKLTYLEENYDFFFIIVFSFIHLSWSYFYPLIRIHILHDLYTSCHSPIGSTVFHRVKGSQFESHLGKLGFFSFFFFLDKYMIWKTISTQKNTKLLRKLLPRKLTYLEENYDFFLLLFSLLFIYHEVIFIPWMKMILYAQNVDLLISALLEIHMMLKEVMMILSLLTRLHVKMTWSVQKPYTYEVIFIP